jgi:peptidyl-prolyl cis-trans isomerase B (cyclophilin B)
MHFLKLVNEGFYDGLTFHRVINEFMIQGGDPNANGTGDYKDGDGNKVTIKGEFSSNGHQNDILHLRGVISMARGNDKNSASCQFFICNATSDWLDGEYAAFGYVIDGMSVIDHVTYDTYIYGDANGSISDKTKQAVIESIVIDELVGITMDDIIGSEDELPGDEPTDEPTGEPTDEPTDEPTGEPAE